ncbi:MAG: hypothetical protein ACRCWJ_11665 [Casimicrobium sp.]
MSTAPREQWHKEKIMIKVEYQVRNYETGDVYGSAPDLQGAVLVAASADGYGAVYQRDEQGEMRLYSSGRHIGNNVYYPVESDAFAAFSALPDDAAAITEVAQQVYDSGILHARFQNLEIVALTFTDGLLTHVDGRTLDQIQSEDYCGDEDFSAAVIRALYR